MQYGRSVVIYFEPGPNPPLSTIPPAAGESPVLGAMTVGQVSIDPGGNTVECFLRKVKVAA